jgi:hypothetical protein
VGVVVVDVKAALRGFFWMIDNYRALAVSDKVVEAAAF